MANLPVRNRRSNRIVRRWRRIKRLRRAWYISLAAAFLILAFNAITGLVSQYTIGPIFLGELAGLLFGIPVGAVVGHIVFELWNRTGMYHYDDAAPNSDMVEGEELDFGEVEFK